MFPATRVILCLTLLNILVQNQCAGESPSLDGYDIVGTEWAIRNTVNNLFSTLKLQDMQQKQKLKQHSTIHNFFVSITLRDHDNLKEIARLTKVGNIDNGTQVFITQLNEVLNEDNKSDEETDRAYITILIEEFLTRLDNLKEIYGLKNNTKTFDINKAIIEYFSNKENDFVNVTKLSKATNNSNDSLLSDNEFWEPSGRRIFDGNAVKIEKYPFMASVLFFKKFQCGGSIIKSDLIITSASCLQLAWNNRFFRENPAFLSVQVGSSFYGREGENIPILEIYFHPNYNPKNLRHNLAIMRMVRSLVFGKCSPQIKKINYDKNPWPLPHTTREITIIGWGAKSISNNNENPWKNKLSYAILQFYPLMECQEIYSREFVTNRHFCAGFFSKGGGACNRDAGGPGVVNSVLMGVISFGSPVCGAPDAPTVFTKLGYYADWIEEIIDMNPLVGRHHSTVLPNSSYYVHKNFNTLILPSTTHIYTTPYKVTPHRVTDSQEYEEPAIIERPSPMNLEEPEHNILRERVKHEKTHGFKDFVSTVFGSDEITDYLGKIEDKKDAEIKMLKQQLREKVEHESKKKIKDLHKKKSKPRKKIKQKTKKKSKSKTKHDTTTKRHTVPHPTRVDVMPKKVVTNLESDYDSYSSEAVTQPSEKHEKVNEDTSTEDKKLEQVIVNLMEDIDLDEILGSEESSSEQLSAEELPQTTAPSHHKTQALTKKKTHNDAALLKDSDDPVEQLYRYLAEKSINNKANENEGLSMTNDGKESDESSSNEGISIGNESDEDADTNNETADESNDENQETADEGGEENENTENAEYDEADETDSDGSNIKKYTMGIAVEPVKKARVIERNDTKKLLQMLFDTEDVYKLLSKAVPGRGKPK